MPTYLLPYPDHFDRDEMDAGFVKDWLTGRGLTVESVSLTKHGISVEADRNPAGDLGSVVDEPPPAERARRAMNELRAIDFATADLATLRRAMNELRAIDFATADLATLRRAMRLMRGLILYEYRSSA